MKYKKKSLLYVLLAAVLTLALAACGSTNTSAKTSRMPVDVRESEWDDDDDWYDDESDNDDDWYDDESDDDDEDSRSYSFTGEEYAGTEDFIGGWMDIESQRAGMSITETDEPGVYDVLIHWSGSYNTAMQWRMQAVAENDIICYEDGQKVEVMFPDDGVEQETVIWDDGTGYFWFDDDGYLRWYDEQEEAAEGCLFVEDE